jgi:hypothetical protein
MKLKALIQQLQKLDKQLDKAGESKVSVLVDEGTMFVKLINQPDIDTYKNKKVVILTLGDEA